LGRDDYDRDHPSIVGVFGGYCYLNLSCTRLFAHRMPMVKVADIDRSLFGEQDAPSWSPPAGARRLGRSAAALRSLLQTVRASSAPAVGASAAETDTWLASLPAVDTASDEELIERIRTFAPRFQALFCRHIFISFQC